MKFKKLFLSLVFMLLFISPCTFAMRGCQEEETSTKCAKVAFIGYYASGKTSIYKRIIGEEYSLNDSKQTRTYRKEDINRIVGNNILSIRLLDTPGLKEYRDEVIDHLSNANIVYIVVDVIKKYDEDIATYLKDICKKITNKSKNCKIVFLFTKYDAIDSYLDYAMPNVANMRSLKDMNKECYFTSSDDYFTCDDQNFIHARDIKQHMINYLREHMDTLPEKHEKTIEISEWEIGEERRQHKKTVNEQKETISRQDDRIEKLESRGFWDYLFGRK